MTIRILLAGIALCIGGLSPAMHSRAGGTGDESSGTQDAERVTVLLVRHAEKEKGGSDPALNDRGMARARALKRVLADLRITRVWTTDYQRTRDTAAPLAADHGLDPRLYDPRDLAALASSLRSQPGIHVVVGHSNTTPALVGLLGGEPGEPIREADEYDRLYWVELGPGGTVASHLLRYDTGPE